MTRKQKWATATAATENRTIGGEKFEVLKLKEFLLHIERWIEYHDNGTIASFVCLPLFPYSVVAFRTLTLGLRQVGVRLFGALVDWHQNERQIHIESPARHVRRNKRYLLSDTFIQLFIVMESNFDGNVCVLCAMLFVERKPIEFPKESCLECCGDAQRIHN